MQEATGSRVKKRLQNQLRPQRQSVETGSQIKCYPNRKSVKKRLQNQRRSNSRLREKGSQDQHFQNSMRR